MGLWTFLYVLTHMITVGDFQSDWRKIFRALEDTKLLWVVKLLLEFYELIAGILGEAAFSLWGLDGAHVDLCLVRAC